MISISSLTKAYGDKVVLDSVSLDVGKGEIVAVMGSSGGGKTTLLKCVSGLIEPTSGSATVAGVDVREDPEGARRKMGMVFQSSALFDYMTVSENILFGVRRRGRLTRDEERALLDEMLDAVQLEEVGDLMPSELSGGMKKRVGMARALALRPEVMLYDEPTTGLDPVTTYAIDSLIASLTELYHVTSLVVSHDVTSVCRLSDRIAFLDRGRLSFIGTPVEFQDASLHAIRDLVSKSEAKTLE